MPKVKKSPAYVKEQRVYQRHKETLKVALCPSDYLLRHDAFSHDISEGGICLFTNYAIEIGQDVELKIHLPELKKPVIAIGKIVRRNETKDTSFVFVLGIKFTKIEPREYAQISNHLKYYILKD